MEISLEQLAAALADVTLTIAGSDTDHNGDAWGHLRYPEEAAGMVLKAVEDRPAVSPHELRATPSPPGYYDGKGGMQPFDVIDAFGLDFYEGNVVKYLVRWRKKNGIEDLRKARTYLNRIISAAEADPSQPSR